VRKCGYAWSASIKSARDGVWEVDGEVKKGWNS